MDHIHQPVLYLLHQGVAVLADNGLYGDVVVPGVFRVWEDVGKGGVAQGVDDVGALDIPQLARQLFVVIGDAEVRHGERMQVGEEVVVLVGLLLKLGRNAGADGATALAVGPSCLAHLSKGEADVRHGGSSGLRLGDGHAL